MASETLSKEFIQIDEENFEVIETRKSTTNINYKVLFKQLDGFKKDITNKLNARKGEEKMLRNAIQTYNDTLKDLEKAKEDFGYDYEVPSEITFEGLVEEINGQTETA